MRLDGAPLFEVVGMRGSANHFSGSIAAGVWLGPSPKPPIELVQMNDKTIKSLAHQWMTASATFARRGTATNETSILYGRHYQFRVGAAFDHVEWLLQAAKAIGQPLNKNWGAEGGLGGELQWSWNTGEHFPKPIGQVTLQEVTLKLPLLNQPIEIADTKIELSKLERRITVNKASALGADWQGTISKRENGQAGISNSGATNSFVPKSGATKSGFTGWDFDLTADHLDATELDRWLGPRERPGWLARLLSPQDASTRGSSSANPIAVAGHLGPLADLNARGNLKVESFQLAPLEVQKLSAEVELKGRKVNLSRFDAQICDGSISGGLLLNLEADPGYWLHLSAKDVNVEELSALSPALQSRLTGQISGEVRVSMHGIGWENLLASLKGAGTISARGAMIQGIDLFDELRADVETGARSTSTDLQFPMVNAEYSVSSRKISFEKITLFNSNVTFEGRGSADFGRSLQLELWPHSIAPKGERMIADPGIRRYRVTGTLETPQVSFEATPQGTIQTLPQKRPQQGSHQGPQPGTPLVRH
jgi:hypothetical protein